MMVNFFLLFVRFFLYLFQNTSIVRINFGANLDAQKVGNDISGIQISKSPPIHAWYIGHTRGLQPLLSPSNILSHRKVPFQKMPPPHGKILKKGPAWQVCSTQLASFEWDVDNFSGWLL
jgi:hypothetical protein